MALQLSASRLASCGELDDAFSTRVQRAQHVRSERGSELSLSGSTWCTTPSYESGSLLPMGRGSLEENLLLGELDVTSKAKESRHNSLDKILTMEVEARHRTHEISDLRDLNTKLQKELEQERQTNIHLRQDRPSGNNISREMINVLETEARSRRQEISDLHELNAELRAELEQERQAVVLLKRNGGSLDGSGGLSREMLATVRAKETEARRDLEQELLKLRSENSKLRAEAATVGTEAQIMFKEELRKLQAENERIRTLMDTAMSKAEAEARKRVEEEVAGLRAEIAALQNDSAASHGAEVKRKAAEKELATMKEEVQKFLTAAHASLIGARTVCVQAEAALKKSSTRAERPPPVYDLQSRDIRSLMMVPDVLSYIADVLLELAAADNKPSWASRGLRYLVC